jgi:tetratricopeptide (TPR) repeat protein
MSFSFPISPLEVSMAKCGHYSAVVVLACACLLVATCSSAQAPPAPNCTGPNASDDLPARYELNQGVEAYKAAHYSEAISHFQKATDIAPCLAMARAYLATAQAQNVVPGLETPDNLKTANVAIENFKQVLAQEPHDVNSLKQVAGVYFSTKQFDDAREWQKKVLVEDPNDYEAAYTIGVIDWTQAHRNVLTVLATVGVVDDGMGNAKAPVEVLEEIKQQNSALIEEAQQYLSLAIEHHPNYDDAMAYINLVFRRKADLDYDNPALRDEDIAKAQEWARKSMQTRKENEEKKKASPDSAQP